MQALWGSVDLLTRLVPKASPRVQLPRHRRRESRRYVKSATQHLVIQIANGDKVPYCGRAPVTATLSGTVVVERDYPKDYTDVMADVDCSWCRRRAGLHRDTARTQPVRQIGVKGRAEQHLLTAAARGLTDALTQSGLSQQEVAVRLGVSQPRVSQVLGAKNLTVRSIARIANALGYQVKLDFIRVGAAEADEVVP